MKRGFQLGKTGYRDWSGLWVKEEIPESWTQSSKRRQRRVMHKDMPNTGGQRQIGPRERCICGSGKRFKDCCQEKT